jgi:hypothetical protein
MPKKMHLVLPSAQGLLFVLTAKVLWRAVSCDEQANKFHRFTGEVLGSSAVNWSLNDEYSDKTSCFMLCAGTLQRQ